MMPGMSEYIPVSGGTTLATQYTGFNPSSYHSEVPIGFSFKYNGKSYTKVGVAPDGYIWFGNTAPTAVTTFERTRPLSGINGPEGIVSAMGTLIHESDAPGTNPSIRVITEGKAPFRYFTVEWKDASDYFHLNNSQHEHFSFQIILYETYNNIDMVYDTPVFSHNESDTVEIGIKGSAASDVMSVTNAGRSWDNPDVNNNPHNYCILSAQKRPEGLIYMWYTGDKYIAVMSPTGDDTFGQGDSIEVRTRSALDATDRLVLEFSSDSGRTYTLIEDNIAPLAEKTMKFKAPAVISSKCFVKVSKASGVLSDSNDVAFGIAASTGLPIFNERKSITVFPNPASDKLMINGDMPAAGAVIEIHDLAGNKVYSGTAADYPVPVHHLDEGCYIIRVTANDAVYVQKFFISR
jgi:hypothetical protein